MGVINMAHGELIAVGAYTTYVVQNIFGAGLALLAVRLATSPCPASTRPARAYDAYFLVALPLSFLMAALVGIALERGIIRFLYRRPLESLLATWGVSLVLQQLFRLTFGANNVQVDSPTLAQRQLDGQRRHLRLEPRLRHRLRRSSSSSALHLAPDQDVARPAHPRRHAKPRRWPRAWACAPSA